MIKIADNIAYIRLEEKFSDLQAEDQGLHNQVSYNSPVEKMSEHLEINSQVECIIFFLRLNSFFLMLAFENLSTPFLFLNWCSI